MDDENIYYQKTEKEYQIEQKNIINIIVID